MTIYEQMGGESALKLAVDQFYGRVLADHTLAPFFESTDLGKLKMHQFNFLSQVTGGPRKYAGATMRRAHSHLQIEQRHFNAVAGHLVATLEALGVRAEIIGEIVAALTPLASEIVNTEAAGA